MDFERPVEALRKELEAQRDDVDNSLIVLPEAFNIGDYWRPRQESDYDPKILDFVSALAVEFNCILVAGLAIRDADGPQSPEPHRNLRPHQPDSGWVPIRHPTVSRVL